MRRPTQQVGWAVPTYCAETDEIAARGAAAHRVLPQQAAAHAAGDAAAAGLSVACLDAGRGRGEARLSTGNQTIEDVIEKGVFLCGSPATLREKLAKYQSEIGFGYLLPSMQFGTLPAELTKKSIEMFARK